MSFYDLAWLALAVYAVHMLEEYELNWRDWARSVIKLPVEWGDFYVTNAIVVVLGIVQAQLSSSLPVLTLSFAALMLINATFFHVLPVIVMRGRFSPGLFTAVALFYPVGLACFWRASVDGKLDAGVIGLAVLIGAALMAYPIVLLRLKTKPYFTQN